ncbi:MAG TPA: DedA family protein, partial [Gaiellaceae bacterium]|nr:DedA family protein [Gaiellaceae bacterium]
VMIESIGVPVPGETALIVGALYAGSTGKLEIWGVIGAAIAGAIIGDNIGFSIGRYGGSKFLLRHGHKIRLDEGRLKIGIWLFRRHGGKVVFWGRFVSILRTWAAFLAGVNRMRWPRFLVFNAAGAIVWATAFGVAYYVFGDVLKRLSTAIDVGLGVVSALLIVAFVIWARRKEVELRERAAREIEGSVAEELGQDDPGP